MVATPPASSEEAAPPTTVSPMTSYSLAMNETGPSIPFFEAQQLHSSAEVVSSEIILSDRDFTVWQLPQSPFPGTTGVQMTPP